MAVVTMKSLLEAGVHFGHQVRRWDPRMKKYIFTQRNGIHIFDLKQTVAKLDEAYAFLSKLSHDGGNVIFVGTKKAAQDIVREEATRAGAWYVNERWVGGLLTNYATVRKSIDRLKQIDREEADGTIEAMGIKERTKTLKTKTRLEKLFGGLRTMDVLPRAIYVIDTHKEHSAIQEAHALGIPVVAIVDTNCNPDEIDYQIPANDDAIRSLRLITSLMANALIEGREGVQQSEASEEHASMADFADENRKEEELAGEAEDSLDDENEVR
ncbi:MAG: 30S ribosomal protein S2 [Candidatus Cryosericum sp.]|nr:30S ribosomal protein S2 [Candidatus Cryosericum sp.]HPS69523.1 30S ribosomal protein S2 [Candidatus Cryosericum sp.]